MKKLTGMIESLVTAMETFLLVTVTTLFAIGIATPFGLLVYAIWRYFIVIVL